MIHVVKTQHVERMRNVVARRLALQHDDSKLAFLEEVLRRRLDATALACDVYLAHLEHEPLDQELRALAQELTIGETYFFRNIDQFRAFAQVVLEARRASGRAPGLRFLSAGCSSGEEAYSIAMLARETVPEMDVSIRAVDINPLALQKAARGRFTAWALRETPPQVQSRWFRPDGRDMVLDEGIRAAVTFEERNLVRDDPELWPADTYDAVFCRNVIMYFTPDNAEVVVGRIARALVPGGHLFLGHAETLRGLSQDFHLCHTHGTFYYQRKDGADGTRAARTAEPRSAALRTPALPGPVHQAGALADFLRTDESWVAAIQRAAERIKDLSGGASPGTARPEAGPARAWDLGQALDLLQREQFNEALAVVQRLPPESARNPDVLLLQAVLLSHGGRLTEAESTCRSLLAIDELNAGAHFVLALCREGAGDRQGAIDEDQVAVYLDPAFAMPRLHLGLQARRAGDSASAQRELGQALLLLQREDASRLLLFGGGFNRDALIALCKAELQACGGRP